MPNELSQRPAVARRVERLVERAIAMALDEDDDDDLATARLAWLARDDQAALDQAGELCLDHAEAGLVVRARAAGLLARVNQQKASYAGWSAGQERIGGWADLEG